MKLTIVLLFILLATIFGKQNEETRKQNFNETISVNINITRWAPSSHSKYRLRQETQNKSLTDICRKLLIGHKRNSSSGINLPKKSIYIVGKNETNSKKRKLFWPRFSLIEAIFKGSISLPVKVELVPISILNINIFYMVKSS